MSDVLALAKQLISEPSITPHDEGCQRILIERLSHLGFHCESLRFGDVDNLWAKYGHHEPLVVFAGHTDVVPSGPEADWASNPFIPEVRNNYLYGRGASDMKGAVAAMVIAAEKFIQAHPSFPGSIAFLITSDEEGPAINGTQKVMEVLAKRREAIQYCIIGEPSSEQQVGDQVRVGRRGSLHGKLKVLGKQGHVAHPHLAKNPIHLAMAALHELSHRTWDEGNEHFPRTTFQITNIHSGTGAANVIPGHLDVLFNFRFSTALTPALLQSTTEEILRKYHLEFEIEWNIGAEPFLTKQGKLIDKTRQAIKDITDIDVKLSTGGGTSDGRFIAPTGAEVVELGVPHATAHQINECVAVDDLSKLVNIYEHLLKLLFY